ncbi:hypothetical protein dsx2_2616 [Desulfovibrio sp. X2]|uniref:hypothetical protein n=1 Tax=Desulfovibrio sp. X2 TaxID=941449 RepID=UPI000358F3CD|nr:hypothetical protein [Desulfovibrio sp. X2]EPR42699.1 hypothetical protein dsx2_2616 [Desulfovibrio sp. X2]
MESTNPNPLPELFEALRQACGSHTAAAKALGYQHGSSYRRARAAAEADPATFPADKRLLLHALIRPGTDQAA